MSSIWRRREFLSLIHIFKLGVNVAQLVGHGGKLGERDRDIVNLAQALAVGVDFPAQNEIIIFAFAKKIFRGGGRFGKDAPR